MNIEPRTLAGFMELLPNEQILFEQMKQTIENVYKRFGFFTIYFFNNLVYNVVIGGNYERKRLKRNFGKFK